jgi:hypothetical protein
MTEQEINITIAETCGATWAKKPVFDHDGRWHWHFGKDPFEFDSSWAGEPPSRDKCILELDVPDYYSDLNAMHEAEKIFDDRHKYTDDTRSLYYDYLALSAEGFPDKWEVSWHVLRATAPQRAEAFLRTVNKWKE